MIHWYILSRSTLRFWFDPVGLVDEEACVVEGAEVVGLGGVGPVTGELLETADIVVSQQVSYRIIGMIRLGEEL